MLYFKTFIGTGNVKLVYCRQLVYGVHEKISMVEHIDQLNTSG